MHTARIGMLSYLPTSNEAQHAIFLIDYLPYLELKLL